MVIIPAMMLHAPADSSAQWMHVATHIFNTSTGPSGGEVYFKDGVLWAGLRQILYSLDTGKTWNISLNSLVGGEVVMNFDFLNSMTGLCRTSNHLYLTQDGGATWNVQTAPGTAGSRYSIFAGSSDIIISLAQNGIYVSTDAGSTWIRKYVGVNPNIAAYKNGGTIAVYESTASRLVISHNYGQTWTAKPVDMNIADSYSMEWDKCDPSLLYLTNEDYFGHNQNRSEVFGTANEGDTWISLIQKPFGYLTGGMAVSPTTTYFQTLSEGVLATTDKGVTWDTIYGPSNFPDTRWLAAVNSKLLIALDQNGDVWQLGTGALGATPNFSMPRQLEITNCKYDSTLVTARGIRCRNFILRDASITGPDSGLFTLRNSTHLPYTLTNYNEGDFFINFDSHHRTGLFTDSLHIRWEDGETGISNDTIFILRANVSSTPSACTITPQILLFDTVSPCRPGSDTIVTIANRGCDTVSILSQPKPLAEGFSFDSLSLPVILPPDSSVQIVYHFRPSLPGLYHTASQITIDGKGSQQVFSVLINGSAQGSDFAAAEFNSQVDMNTVSTCSPFEDTLITIANLGCVPMRLTRKFSTLVAAFSIDARSFPIIIPSDSSVSFPLHFHPSVPAEYSQDLKFGADWNGFGTRDIDFHLHAKCIDSKTGPFVPDTTIDFGLTSMCDPFKDTSIVISNPGCDTLTILSGSGTFGKAISISDLHFPIVLPPGSGMRVAFHFRPQSPDTYHAEMEFSAVRGSSTHEIKLHIVGRTGRSIMVPLIKDQNIDLGKISICNAERDTVVTFANHSCDTIRIVSGPGILAGGFSMEPLLLPVTLPPDDSVNITFHFSPPNIGNFTAMPHFEFEHEGMRSPVDLYLRCDAGPGKSIFSLVTPTVAFAQLSICRSDSAEIVYTNSGCDTIYVTPLGLTGDADFIAKPDIERALGRGDSIHIPIHFVPVQKGERSAVYNLRCHARSGEIFDTSVSISGLVTNGTKILQSNLTSVDFGSTRLCTAPDSNLLLFNSGCDTLVISKAQFAGGGFELSGVYFPIMLLPGESKLLRIVTKLDTAGRNPTSQAMLTLSSTSDMTLAPIMLSHGYRYPSDYPVRIEPVNNALKSKDIFTVRILADSLPGDLLQLDAKFFVDHPDLLLYLSAQSKNTVSLQGDKLTITGNPIVAPNNVIAELSYRVYLTKDSTSDISLSGIRFNPLDDDYMQCMALSSSVSQTVFNYGFECGEKTIMLELNGELSARIFSLRPNPASRHIDVDLKTLDPEDIEVSVIDARGASVLRELRHHPKGRSDLSVDVSSLSSGSYILNVKAGASDLHTPFIIQK